MSVISTSGLTLGYFTLPLASAEGWPGSYFTRNCELSVLILPSATTRAPSARSMAERKVGIRRRNGSASARCAVESALAMFSERTRMRPDWARRPEAATAIVFRKSIVPHLSSLACQLALAECALDQRKPARVERGRRLVVHGVRRHLEHLVLEANCVAGRPRFEIELAIEAEPRRSAAGRIGDMARIRTRERQRACRHPGLVEIRWDEIAWRELWGVGVGHVLRQQALALLMPMHLGAQHRKDRHIGDRHRSSFGFPVDSDRPTRWRHTHGRRLGDTRPRGTQQARRNRTDGQTLPSPWLMPG